MSNYRLSRVINTTAYIRRKTLFEKTKTVIPRCLRNAMDLARST